MLDIHNLKIVFRTGETTIVAVDGVDLAINKGDVVGLVGESGCGKTVTAMSILRLLPATASVSGDLLWQGKNMLSLSKKELRSVRGGQISMIFQNPVSSLNPVFPVGTQIVDVLRLHRNLTLQEAEREALRLFELVKIPAAKSRLWDYPHQFSGGMCQRIMIAMAIAARPQLLIADEPTASLDVTIQAQIVSLLRELNEELGMSILMISHDMGVIANICDRIAVMYLGRIVESGPVEDVFERTAHPYTEALLRSIPVPDPAMRGRLEVLAGDIPSPSELPVGCRFAGRCKYRNEKCTAGYPQLDCVDGEHLSACYFSGSFS